MLLPQRVKLRVRVLCRRRGFGVEQQRDQREGCAPPAHRLAVSALERARRYPRLPLSGALPNMPSLTLPDISSLSTVAENSSVKGMG